MLKKKTIYPAYALKHNSNCKQQVMISMIQMEKNMKLSPKDDDVIIL